MEGDGGSERWGGDIDFNEWSPTAPTTRDESPQWEPTPPPRWSGRRIAMVVGGALAATLIGVGGVLGVMSLFDDGGPSSSDGSGDPGSTAGDVAADTPPPVLDVELDWYAVDGTLGLTERVATSAGGEFYALSTAPGQAFDWPPQKAIYHTTDGEVWDFALLDDTIGGSDLTVHNDVLYLIGTAPGFGGFGEAPIIVMSSSNDGGQSWDQASLPTTAAPPAAGGNVGFTELSMHVASSGDGMVAVVQTNFWIDLWELVPRELLGEMRDPRATEDGVEIIDYSIFQQLEMECEAAGGMGGNVDDDDLPEPCRKLFTGDVEGAVVDTLTWEELGLEGGQPVFSEVFFSSDGESWQAVESPFTPGRTLSSLHSLSTGFVATQWRDFGGHTIYTSPDGITWSTAAGLPEFDWIVGAGSVGGRDVIVGTVIGKPTAAWSDGNGGWTEIDIATAADVAVGGQSWLSAGGVGPLGVVAIIETEGAGIQPSGPTLVHATAPDDWVALSLSTLVGGQWGYSDWVVVGEDQVLVRYQESGPQQTINLQLVGTPG